MKLTSYGFLCRQSRGFFVRVRTKVPYFFAHNSQHKHPSITDRPSKPCLMASKSSDDGRHSHPTPSSMSSLTSVALEAVNFAVGVRKQPPQHHEDGAMGGSSKSAPDTFESMNWEIERAAIDWGTQQSTGLRETEGGNTTIISLSSPGPIRGHRQPVLPTNTTINSSHLRSLSRTNGRRDHLQWRCKTNNNQPKKVEVFVLNLLLVLCFIS
jgi:hypothetical protein